MDQFDNIGTGTTLIALQFEDGVVIGAESRVTDVRDLSVISRFTNKLVKIRENIYCCGSGSSAHIENVIDWTKRDLKVYELNTGLKASVGFVAKRLQMTCLNERSDNSYALIIAGYDEHNGGEVYSLANGMLHKEEFAMQGSGSTYVYIHAKEEYRFGMTESEAVELIAKTLKCAISADPMSGGSTNIAIITENGVKNKVIYNTLSGNALQKF